MKALTIGGAMIDTIAIVEDDLIERISLSNAGKTFLLLEQGSKTEAVSISTHCGGGAINAAVALSRLGFAVSALAKIGEDERAGLVRAALAAENIATSGLRTTPLFPTGASAIISAHDRNAAIFTFRGANTQLREEDIDPAAFRGDLVYISTLSGDSAAILPRLVEAAASASALVAVNPGIRQITTRFASLRKLLSRIGIVALNRVEAEAFVRQAVAELSGSENVLLRQFAAASLEISARDGSADRSDAARALIAGILHLGANTVLLTDGRHGAYAGSRNEIVYCPGLTVPVVSTAGAGDAYVSTFCAMTVLGADTEQAMRAAAENAAAVVMRGDTQSGLLSYAAIKARLDVNAQAFSIRRWAP